MLQKKDSKERLFEVMRRVAPNFKGETLNENSKPAKGKQPLKEGDDKWIQGAVNPEHKGFCTPMTKDTCTPRRKALAKRFKKGIDENGFEGMEEMSMEEKYEELVALVDELYGIIHNEEEPQVEPEISEPQIGEPEAGESPEHEAGETPEEEKAEHEPGGEEFGEKEPEEDKVEELYESKKKK